MTDRESLAQHKPGRKPHDDESAPAGARRGQHDRSVETRLWLRMLGCCNSVEAELRSRMRENFGTTLARFDVLTQLARAPVGPTMGELSERLMVTKGNITDVIRRLESEQLVERRRDAVDARVQRVYLTVAGRRSLQEMVPAHRRWLADLMRDADSKDLQALDDLLGRFRSALRSATGKS